MKIKLSPMQKLVVAFAVTVLLIAFVVALGCYYHSHLVVEI